MLVQGLQINKATAGSGGFKVPYESIEKRQKRNTMEIPNDLPSREELFSQLGLIADDASMKPNIQQNNQIAVSRRMIQEKQEQLQQAPKQQKPPTVQIVKKQMTQQRLTAEELETMLEEHRKQMKPLEEEYLENRLENKRSNPYRSVSAKKSQRTKVQVTYHKENQSTEKMRRSQRDLSGPHGDFLREALPKQNLQKLNSERKLINGEDFQNKFKNYLRNKRQQNEEEVSQVEFDLYQSTSPNQGRWNVKHQNKAVFSNRKNDDSKNSSKSKSRSRSKQKQKLSMNRNELIEQIFKQIDLKNQKIIDKLGLIKYFVSNTEIMEAFDIHPKDLNTAVNKFPTKRQDAFTLQEFQNFLNSFQGEQSQHEAFGGLSHVSQQQQQSSCLLNKEQINQLKKVFDQIQVDMIADRLQLVKTMRNDIQIIKLLHQQAAYVSQIDKIVNLDNILSQIETQAKEYPFISWKQFMDQFEYDTPISKQQLSYVSLRDNQKQSDDQDKIDAPSTLIELIQAQFKIMEMDGYAQTSQLAEAIRRSPLYSSLKINIIRKQSKSSDIPQETLENLLIRIEDDAHEYLTIEEFLDYFTRRGFPKFQDEVASLAKSVNVTEALRNQDNLIDGYDSDPELHTYQDKMLPRQRLTKKHPSSGDILTYSHRKQKTNKSNSNSQRKLTKEDFLSQIQPKPNYGAYSKPSDYQFTVTQPQPFNFDKREKERSISIRQRKLQEMLDEKKQQEIFKPFKPKEIPLAVKQPLYQKITDDNLRRREEVKKNSVQITKQNEKPFSFYNREGRPPRKKYWQEREKFVFTAKAIPWHVHVELLKQMEQDEIIKRKERIAKHAHELAMNSKMPARMEMHERQKQGQSKSPKQYNTQVLYKAKPIPDFERLHGSFMESLNRKKQQMRTTDPKPFNFQESHKSLERPYLDQENLVRIVKPIDKIEEARKKMSVKPAKQPSSTKKWEANCELLRKQKKEKADKELQLQKEERERQERKEKFKDRVQKSEAIHDNSKKLAQQRKDRIAQLKKEANDQEERQKQTIQQCIQKAHNQPLLVERPTQRDVKMEKMKQLNKLDKILKENGVLKRDEFFKKDELEILKDMEYLKKHGYEDDFE